MTRIALVLAYHGASFQGWQSQTHGISVQDHLQKSLSSLLGSATHVTAAGRTDTGVHATHQVVHFDSQVERADTAFTRGLNSLLPDTIAVQSSLEVASDFQARFSAQRRRYHYVIYRAAHRHPQWHQRATWVFQNLDLAAMVQAAQYLLGEQDFSSFRSSQCQAHSPVRQLQAISFREHGPLLSMSFVGNGFLHHMIRNIVGSLAFVGMGRKPIDWLAEVLNAKDRKLAAPTFSAQGLYFTGVDYGSEHAVTAMSWPSVPAVEQLIGLS